MPAHDSYPGTSSALGPDDPLAHRPPGDPHDQGSRQVTIETVRRDVLWLRPDFFLQRLRRGGRSRMATWRKRSARDVDFAILPGRSGPAGGDPTRRPTPEAEGRNGERIPTYQQTLCPSLAPRRGRSGRFGVGTGDSGRFGVGQFLLCLYFISGNYPSNYFYSIAV